MRLVATFTLAAVLPLLGQSPFYSQQEYQLGHSLFENILSDLQTVHASATASLIAMARAEVLSLAQNWTSGVYDHQQMDSTIRSLETISDRTVSLPDRVNLDADVSRLLDLRKAYY